MSSLEAKVIESDFAARLLCSGDAGEVTAVLLLDLGCEVSQSVAL